MSICRAKGCTNEGMPDSDFCGLHDEMAEDGEPFEIKPIRVNPNNFTKEEKARKWQEIRTRERLSKRKKHPEWKELTRRQGANTVEEMAALYDARRAREKQYKENQIKYADRDTRRAVVKDITLQIVDEIKAKREQRRLARENAQTDL